MKHGDNKMQKLQVSNLVNQLCPNVWSTYDPSVPQHHII